MTDRDATIVIDIGKTNAKLTLIDADGKTLAEQRVGNTIDVTGQYPHHDTERLWTWMLATFRIYAGMAKVGAIVPVTHGATAALVDDDGLVLPVLDYESKLPEQIDAQYVEVRPPFSETYSPDLPAGLNLGRQLAWLSTNFPSEFARAKHILMYPQYWAWRLSGVAASEVTSLGCHTDLWNTVAQDYSSLVAHMGWHCLFPPMQAASQVLGPLLPELVEQTGLPADCKIVCGIHDSNASLLRYLGGDVGTVLSSGTWLIAASFNTQLDQLDERADMLANTNALGQPVACMRFMGGREFAVLAGTQPTICSLEDIRYIVGAQIFALPSFAEAGGAFSDDVGMIIGLEPRTKKEWYALATLYCVLMSDYCLNSLQSTGSIVVEGSFTVNPYFAPLLQQLRPFNRIIVSNDSNGTTSGGWGLNHTKSAWPWQGISSRGLGVRLLDSYKRRWNSEIEHRRSIAQR